MTDFIKVVMLVPVLLFSPCPCPNVLEKNIMAISMFCVILADKYWKGSSIEMHLHSAIYTVTDSVPKEINCCFFGVAPGSITIPRSYFLLPFVIIL